MAKTLKKWTLKSVDARFVEKYLDDISLKGDKIFSIFASHTVSGAFDVLTSHDEKILVPPNPKPTPKPLAKGDTNGSKA
jgi:hypothetical protein